MAKLSYKRPEYVSSSTNRPADLSDGNVKYSVFEDEILKIKGKFWGELKALQDQLREYQEESEGLRKELLELKTKEIDGGYKSIQTIGLFSSVLALIITNINIVTRVDGLFSMLVLMVAMNCSLLMFAAIISFYFTVGSPKGLGKSFWVPCLLLILVVCLVSMWSFFVIHGAVAV